MAHCLPPPQRSVGALCPRAVHDAVCGMATRFFVAHGVLQAPPAELETDTHDAALIRKASGRVEDAVRRLQQHVVGADTVFAQLAATVAYWPSEFVHLRDHDLAAVAKAGAATDN